MTKAKKTATKPTMPATFDFKHASLEGSFSLPVYDETIALEDVIEAIGSLAATPPMCEEVTEIVRGRKTSFRVVKPAVLAQWLVDNASVGLSTDVSPMVDTLVTATPAGDATAQLSASVRIAHRDAVVQAARDAGLEAATPDNDMPYLSTEIGTGTRKEVMKRERQGQAIVIRIAMAVAAGEVVLTPHGVTGLDYSELLSTWGVEA